MGCRDCVGMPSFNWLKLEPSPRFLRSLAISTPKLLTVTKAGQSVDIMSPQDAIKEHLNCLLSSRDYPKTICPSEVARALSSDELEAVGAKQWRDIMPMIREIAWEMRDQGAIDILQRGQVLDHNVGIADVKGPIRLRRSRKEDQS